MGGLALGLVYAGIRWGADEVGGLAVLTHLVALLIGMVLMLAALSGGDQERHAPPDALREHLRANPYGDGPPYTHDL